MVLPLPCSLSLSLTSATPTTASTPPPKSRCPTVRASATEILLSHHMYEVLPEVLISYGCNVQRCRLWWLPEIDRIFPEISFFNTVEYFRAVSFLPYSYTFEGTICIIYNVVHVHDYKYTLQSHKDVWKSSLTEMPRSLPGSVLVANESWRESWLKRLVWQIITKLIF